MNRISASTRGLAGHTAAQPPVNPASPNVLENWFPKYLIYAISWGLAYGPVKRALWAVWCSVALTVLAGCEGENPSTPTPAAATPTSTEVSAPAQLSSAAAKEPAQAKERADALECMKTCHGLLTEAGNATHLPLGRSFAEALGSNSNLLQRFLELVAQLPAPVQPLSGVDLLLNTEMPLKSADPMTIESGDTVYQVWGTVNYQSNGSDYRPNGYVSKANYLYGALSVVADVKTGSMAVIYRDSAHVLVRGEGPSGIALAHHIAREIYEERKSNDHWRLSSDNELSFPLNDEHHTLATNRLYQIAAVYKNGNAIDVGRISLKSILPTPDPSTVWFSANRSHSECFESRGPAHKLSELNGYQGLRTSEVKDAAGRLEKVEVIKEDGRGSETVWTYYKNQSLCVEQQVNVGNRLANKYR
jgi:hypothetical protein